MPAQLGLTLADSKLRKGAEIPRYERQCDNNRKIRVHNQ